MAKGDWWLKLNMNDWLTDPALRRLRRENRDSWLTACLMMTKAGEYQIKGTMDEVGILLHLTPDEMKAFVDDLKRHNVADVTLLSRSSHVDVTLVSRRYKKEAKAKKQNTLRKRKQREKNNVTLESRDIVISKKKEVRKEEDLRGATALPPIAPKYTTSDDDPHQSETPAGSGTSEPDSAAPSDSEAAKSAASADLRRNHPAIVLIRETTGIYPPKVIWDEIIDQLGLDIDAVRMKQAFVKWRARGFNKTNYDWALDWYLNGIPDQSKSLQRSNNHVTTNGTTNFRQQREQEAIRDYNVIEAARARVAARDLLRQHAGNSERQLRGLISDADIGGENETGGNVGATATRHHPGEPVAGML